MSRKKKAGVPPESPVEQPEMAGTQASHPPEQPPISSSTPVTGVDFPIVGIGASAGGLAALEGFLSGMPSNTKTGIAFVFVQHLAPDHVSILSELVRRYTSMEVREVEDGMSVVPDTLYIIPPNRKMAVLNGTLELFQPTAPHGHRLPIDDFFRSLAQDQHRRAICVVLSGTGTDGTLGARAVKGEGGMVMAQDPESADYEGMPVSLIATGIVDYILPPAEMPAQILAYVGQMFGQQPHHLETQTQHFASTLKKICLIVRTQTGHDFSQYKENTVARRVIRRMAIHQIDSAENYLRFLQSAPGETEALFRDLLIGVTSFFRDPDAFAALQEKAIPRLLAGKAPGTLVRVWVAGCSTGEEAYSIAILCQETLNALHESYGVQIFATDIDSVAINQARSGVFPVSIATDVSEERLAQFFVLEPGNAYYRIKKSIRDMVIFSEQDLIKDPPFSRVDLVSCRNVLIYMNADLQKKLIPLFHYALNPDGIMFLGSSESAGEHTSLFAALDRKWKLYTRRQDLAKPPRLVFTDFQTSSFQAGSGAMAKAKKVGDNSIDLRNLTEQALLAYFGQAAVLVNGRGEIRFIHGRTGKFLEPAPGDATVNILTMARDGLRRDLTTALHKAAMRNEVAAVSGLRIKTNGDFITARLVVQPIQLPNESSDPHLFLVILEETPAIAPVPVDLPAEDGKQANTTKPDLRIAALEQELAAKEEYLQSTLEEMETTNEELRSTNEELQSVNEELQSTNEELETSKEELQSVNEELATVNAELQAKVVELSRANNDMNNLLAGSGIGTLFVDHQLRITRFTPAITQVINLIQSDIGRPIAHFVADLVGYGNLVGDVKAVLEDLVPRDAVLQTTADTWYLMRIRPYRTLDNVIEGAVITFVDITERRRAEATIRTQLAEIASYYDNAPIGLAVIDNNLRFVRINKRLAEINGLPAAEHIGKTIAAVTPDLAEQARKTTEKIRATGEPVIDLRISGETDAEPGIQRAWKTGWYPLKDDEGTIIGFSIIMHEQLDIRDHENHST